MEGLCSYGIAYNSIFELERALSLLRARAQAPRCDVREHVGHECISGVGSTPFPIFSRHGRLLHLRTPTLVRNNSIFEIERALLLLRYNVQDCKCDVRGHVGPSCSKSVGPTPFSHISSPW